MEAHEQQQQDAAAAGAAIKPKRKPPRLTLADSALPLGLSLHNHAHPAAAATTADRDATAASEQSERPPASAVAPAAPSRVSERLSSPTRDDEPASAVALFLSTLSADGVASAPGSSARPDPIAASAIGSRRQVAEKFKKRGRVESANLDEHSFTRASSRSHAITLLQASAGSGASRVTAAPTALSSRTKRGLPRSHSTPTLCSQADNTAITNIFPDINPRHLRIAEVKSWYCAWMDKPPPASPDASSVITRALQQQQTAAAVTSPRSPLPLLRHVPRLAGVQSPLRGPFTPPLVQSPRAQASRAVDEQLDDEIVALTSAFALEDKASVAPAPTTSTTSSRSTSPPPLTTATPSSKRPQLRLKLEDMPTPQQAEDRAQRAANRLIAKREAMEKAMAASAGTADASTAAADAATPSAAPGMSAAQHALVRLNFKSYSSGDDSDLQSPSDAGRHSAGSAYSPNHGMFTTKSVAVSEAGISSPDSACLHLQENLEKVREVGRGASGIVYKAIHIPTLKVVAIKDVPVYGRGQRRQMVRELHALYSNLVPISTERDSPTASAHGSAPPRSTSSPYIVSFYDAFVDRPKNSICLVMEYMSTGSLQDIVLRGGCQNEKILARLALGVLRGLAHIHKKHMIHRDIKPHNLLTNRQGDVKISDFGLARTLNDNLSSAKTFVGTLLYMAPERIGGGDYSYPADIWSFGLALISVALGKYPLPTQDGFFGLVDSVANEKFLELPADVFSQECRSFVQECVRIDPDERPSAQDLLTHPFVTMYSPDETLTEWTAFIEEKQLCEDRVAEVDSLADAVYRHIYERCVKFSFQPQSDYGVSFLSQATPAFSRRHITIDPVQMSLQLGLANVLGVPVHKVYEQFEVKRSFYSDKLLEDYCYSPQSWTASPGDARRQQLFGSDTESPGRPTTRHKGSFWRKLQSSMAKLGSRRKKRDSATGRDADDTRSSSRWT